MKNEIEAFIVGALIVVAVLIISLFSALIANARDEGQWKYAAPDVQEYFKTLKQPDNENVSCCGDSDCYWTDDQEIDANGNTVAIITDTRPDTWKRPDGSTGRRPHIDVGTKVVVPANKIRKHPIPNPLSHGLIFLSNSGWVYCYEPLSLG